MKFLKDIEKLINSELATKIQNSFIKNSELTIEIDENNLIEVIQFLKSHEKCKFKQLIDIAGVDFPEDEKRFKLVYLFLSHELNHRIKVSVKFEPKQNITLMYFARIGTSIFNNFSAARAKACSWFIGAT